MVINVPIEAFNAATLAAVTNAPAKLLAEIVPDNPALPVEIILASNVPVETFNAPKLDVVTNAPAKLPAEIVEVT